MPRPGASVSNPVPELLDSSTSELLDFLTLSFIFIDISGSFVQIQLSALQPDRPPSLLVEGLGR